MNYKPKTEKFSVVSAVNRYILKEDIAVLFDDVDEYFRDLPAEVAIFKIRQKYNFDFTEKKRL